MAADRDDKRVRSASLPGRRRWAATLLVGIGAAFYAVPILYMAVASVKPDARVLADGASWRALWPVDASLANYRDVFARVHFWRVMANSLVITSTIVLAGLPVNGLAGYALARLSWRGRELILALVLALLIIPFETIAVPLFYQVCLLGWRDSYLVQILPFVADALAIYLFYSFFAGLPRELEEAARLDGASPWQIFRLIIVPNATGVVSTVAILTFVLRWGSYLWPLLVTVGERYRPLPVALAVFQTQVKDWGDIMAFGMMMVAPVLLLFCIGQRWLVESIAGAGLKR